MKVMRSGEFVVVRLDEGDEVISSLERAAREEGIGAAVILSFVGALESSKLILQKGVDKELPFHTEAVGNGNIALLENSRFVHLHVALGCERGTWVGHLLRGVVGIFCEVIMAPIKPPLKRKYDRELAEKGITIPFCLEVG